MSKVLYTVNCILLGWVVWAQDGLFLHETPDLNKGYVRRATQLMEAKCIPDGNRDEACTSWSFPTSIVVGATNYRVIGDRVHGQFEVFPATNSVKSVVKGYAMRMRDGQIARLWGFLMMAENNLSIDDFEPTVSVRNLGASTNMLYISSSLHASDQEDVLVCKNLCMSISGATNKLDFATAIMNAGLPENEKIRVSVQ